MAQADQGGAEDAELAALEALADEIQAEGEAESDHERPDEQSGAAPGAAESPAGGGSSDGVWVRECWEQATDLNSGRPYWFNRATGVSTWFPPAEWGAARAGAGPKPQHAPAPAAAAGEAGAAQPPQQPQSDRAYKPGLYYRDAFQQLQGPFTVEQLREWRGMLPMNLAVLRREAGPLGSGTDEAERRQQGSTAGGSEGIGSEADWTELQLAGVLGDEELLERWQLENPEQAAWPGSAPPATAYEAERQRGTAHSLAQAVLYGLPAHDEAVGVARLAAASGRSMEEVLEWGRAQQADYTSTAYRVAARGRIQAPGAPEPLYAEVSSWANPHELGEQLARAAAARKRTLTPEELRAVKQRKKEMKEKKMRAWLAD